MKRLGSFGAVLPFLALGAASCGANTEQGGNPNYKFTTLADFEASMGFVPTEPPPSLWNGGFAPDADKSPLPPGYAMSCPTAKDRLCGFELVALASPRVNPDGSMSTTVAHATDNGGHTLWGSVIYGDLQSSKKPVDLSRFKGISFWARSGGQPGFPVRVGIADLGSFDFGQVGLLPDNPMQLCNALDTTVGGNGCYDDYQARIYPDSVWRRYDIPFSSLATGGWGRPHAFDQTRVMRIKISMLPTTVYDLYFDDFAFYSD